MVCIRQAVCLRDRWSCAFVIERSNNALSHCTCAHIYGRSGAAAKQLQEHGYKFQLVLVKAPARWGGKQSDMILAFYEGRNQSTGGWTESAKAGGQDQHRWKFLWRRNSLQEVAVGSLCH